MQDAVWNLRHSASEHIPGKLSLCIGLPVMIRNNDATELCITKGQEDHIVGWKSGTGSRGQLILETLYVKLDRLAKNINIEGLPENDVPLMKGIETKCQCIREGHLIDFSENSLKLHGSKRCVSVVYSV
jgi:hypothetical protein